MFFQSETFNFRQFIQASRRIGCGIFLMLGMLLGIIVFGSMDDEVCGSGIVAGIREYDLKALVSAPSVKIFHHEGEEVAPGDPVMELDSRSQREKITLLKHELKELEMKVAAKEKAFEITRRDPLPDYYRNTELELDAAKEKLKLAEKEFVIYSDLFSKKTVTRKEFLQIELNLLSCRNTVARLERDRKRLDDGMAQQIVNRAKDELEQLRHQLSGKRDELAMEIRRLDDYIIRAPDHGVITEIPPRPGNFYNRGDAVAKFAAHKYKKIIGMIPEGQIYKVHSGQSVRIESNQYNYLDYGYFPGTVDEVYQLPEKIDGVNYYPVKILLDDERFPLRFGSGCEVTIITGRERIIALLMGIRSKDYFVRRGLTERK